MSERLQTDSHLRGCVKGTVLLSRLELIRSERGQGGVERVCARLPPEERALVAGPIMPMAWYPFETNDRIDLAIVSELGGQDSIFLTLGARSAEDNLGASHRSYVRSKDPQGLLKQAAQIYRLYYNTGYRTYEWVASNKAILRTFDAKAYSRHDCLTVVGWHEKAIELCGGRRQRVTEPRCRVRGDEHCEYVCEWQAPQSSGG
jgi:uncharacterized protein (TIGR02265 family)